MRTRPIPPILVVLIISTTIAISEVIKPNSLEARSDGVNITLRWVTDDETNVSRFEIERRSESDLSYALVGTVDPRGPSTYEFVDRTAFRKVAAVYHYRIKVIFVNGASPVYSQEVPVSHTVSGVRRTWGSIKALFR